MGVKPIPPRMSAEICRMGCRSHRKRLSLAIISHKTIKYPLDRGMVGGVFIITL